MQLRFLRPEKSLIELLKIKIDFTLYYYSQRSGFISLSYVRCGKSFDTLEDIFEFVASSNYFDRRIFSLEVLGHVNRIRNKKRKTYMDFLHFFERRKLEPGRFAGMWKEKFVEKLFEIFEKYHHLEK